MEDGKKAGVKPYVLKQPYGTHQIGQTIELTEEEAKPLIAQGVVEDVKPEDKA